MFRYIMKRILWLVPILLGVSFIVFTIMYLSPGDPVTLILEKGQAKKLMRLFEFKWDLIEVL